MTTPIAKQATLLRVKDAGLLGNLWMGGYFEAGDPLVRGGRPKARVGS